MKVSSKNPALLSLLVMFATAAAVPAFADSPDYQVENAWHLSVGLAVHDPALDWHVPPSDMPKGEDKNDGYLSNPLGIVKLHYQSGRWDIGVQHISSIPNKHDNWGVTMGYVTVDLF